MEQSKNILEVSKSLIKKHQYLVGYQKLWQDNYTRKAFIDVEEKKNARESGEAIYDEVIKYHNKYNLDSDDSDGVLKNIGDIIITTLTRIN